MAAGRGFTLWPVLGAALLAGCLPASDAVPPAAPPEAPSAPAPQAAPVTAPDPEPSAAAKPEPDAAPSAQSLRLTRYYAEVETGLLARGFLRRDGGGALSAEALTRDFMAVALFNETESGARPAVLRRWNRPVQIALRFGASVPPAQRIRDRRTLSALARDLSEDTGLPVTIGTESGDFLVYIVDEDERRALPATLAEEVSGLDLAEARRIVDLPISTYCAVFSYSDGARPDMTRALAFIRAEQPPVLRESCLHEEIAQGFGLTNDDSRVRPSIFNDDEEFALLTPHDHALMRILYDARLRTGMDAAQALPLVTQIAAEIAPPSL